MNLHQASAYLPHGLKCEVIGNDEIVCVKELTGFDLKTSSKYALFGWSTTGMFGNESLLFDSFKPILFPLDCLTREIQLKDYNDGKPFVPIEELLKDNLNIEVRDVKIVGGIVVWKDRVLMSLAVDRMQYGHVQTLLLWKINVFNLPEDEYINVESLTENPYA